MINLAPRAILSGGGQPTAARLLFLCAGALAAGPCLAAVTQAPGADHVVLRAALPDQVLNPDAANDVRSSSQTGSPESPAQVWAAVADAAAITGQALLAPPSPHNQNSNPALQESIAGFDITFATAGSYRAYVRGRNNGTPGNGSSDSMWLPLGFGDTAPSSQRTLANSGAYEWREHTTITYSVAPPDVGAARRLWIGARESAARVDTIILSTQQGLSTTQLDELAGLEEPPPGGDCVSSPAELQAALATALPGDVITLCDGTWVGAVLVVDGLATANGSGGTLAAPITVRAETPGQVRLTGESKLWISGNHMHVDGLLFEDGRSTAGQEIIRFRRTSSNRAFACRLSNTAIIGYNPADASTDYKWVSVYGEKNEVVDCAFVGMDHKGVQLTVWLENGRPSSETLIQGCHFADRAPGDGNGYETIRIGTSDTSLNDARCIVRGNLFERLDGETEIISNKSEENQYIGNTFRASEGQLTLRHGADCIVDGNFFFGDGVALSSGVRIIGPGHVVVNNYFEGLRGENFYAALGMMNGVPDSPLNRYLQMEDCLVAFNTFVDCVQPLAIGIESSDGDTTLPPRDSIVANNLVAGAPGAVINDINAPINFTWEGNIFQGASLGILTTPGVTLGDPGLALSGSLWRPAAGSPAIDGAAGDYPMVTTDMDGEARPVIGKDAGADEAGGPGPVRRPLTPNDVGPLWAREDSSLAAHAWLVR